MRYPDAEKIVVVLDNLNTHTPASFYKVFELEEAFELFQRFEFHYTPKHGSWLNMAEIELSAMTRECLNQRIGDVSILARYVSLWERERNNNLVKVDWRFTTQNARMKLKHLYLTFKNQDWQSTSQKSWYKKLELSCLVWQSCQSRCLYL